MSKNKADAPIVNRKHLSRAQRDRQMQRYVVIGAGVVAAVLVLLLGYAALDVLVLQPAQPVARVGDSRITVDEFQRAVRYRRYQMVENYLSGLNFLQANPQFQQFFQSQLQQLQSQLADTQGLGQTILNEMIDDRLIRQEAAKRGLTISADDLQASLHNSFGFYPNGTPSPTLTPSALPTYAPPTLNPTTVAAWTPTVTLTPTVTFTPTETATAGPSPTSTPTETPGPTNTPISTQAYGEAWSTQVASVKQSASVDEAVVKYWAEAALYKKKLGAILAADVPATDEEVHARHILVADEAQAQDILKQLQAGADWDALANQYSTDTSNKAKGGDLGWFGKGKMVAEFETAAFSMTVGSISSAPVKSQFGWHILQLLERGQRPLSASDYQAKKDQVLTDWLAAQRQVKDAAGTLLVQTYDIWVERVPTTPALPASATQ